MPTYTTNFNLAKPLVNDPTDEDLWGGELNSNMDIIDAALKAVTPSTSDVSTTYLVVLADRNKFFQADATATAFSITLPTAASAGSGFSVAFKKIDASANAVTIVPNGAETIDGSANYILSAQNDPVILVSTGTTWRILARSRSRSTQAQAEAGVDNTTDMSPLTTKQAVTAFQAPYLPSFAKAFGSFNSAGSVQPSAFNIGSIVRNSTGVYTVTLSFALSSTDYIVLPTINGSGAISLTSIRITGKLNNAFIVRTYVDNNTTNPSPSDFPVDFIVFGV